MNIFGFLKKLFSPTFEKAKAQVLKELDRAISDLTSPNSKTVATIVRELRSQLLKVLGAAHLPDAASFLLDMVLAGVDWNGLADKPAAQVAEALGRIRTKVAGARL